MKRILSIAAVLAACMLGALPAHAETPPGSVPSASASTPTPPAPSPSAPSTAQQPAAATKTKRARVLTACGYGQANDLADIPADEVKEAVKAGLIDTDPAAIDYAASLPQNQKPKDT